MSVPAAAHDRIPRSEAGTCTMHNFDFVPLRDGRKVLVSAAYTGGIFADDILRGLDIFLLSDDARAGARRLPYLNPQTQVALIP